MATWLIGGALFLIVGAVTWKMVKDRRAGKGGCCGDCSHCPGCHEN